MSVTISTNGTINVSVEQIGRQGAPGSGGVGNVTGMAFQSVATHADMPTTPDAPTLFHVDEDETNNGDASVYLFTGISFIQLQRF